MIFRGIHRSDRPLSDPGEARTLDPMIKSHLLYQLSYGVIFLFDLLLNVSNFIAAILGVLNLYSYRSFHRLVRCFPQLRCKVKQLFFIDQIFGELFLKYFLTT